MNMIGLIAAPLLPAMLLAASRAFAVPAGYIEPVFADPAAKLSF